MAAYNFDPEMWLFVFNKLDKVPTDEYLLARINLFKERLKIEWAHGTYILNDEKSELFLPRLIDHMAFLTPTEINPEEVKEIQLTSDKLAEEIKKSHLVQQELNSKLTQMEKNNAALTQQVKNLLEKQKEKKPWWEKIIDPAIKLVELLVTKKK